MSASASARTRIAVPADVLFQQVNDQAALLNLATETYFGLDDVGARMWQALERTGSVEDAVSELQGIYDAEPARVEGDLRGLVAQLRTHGLIVVEDA